MAEIHPQEFQKFEENFNSIVEKYFAETRKSMKEFYINQQKAVDEGLELIFADLRSYLNSTDSNSYPDETNNSNCDLEIQSEAESDSGVLKTEIPLIVVIDVERRTEGHQNRQEEVLLILPSKSKRQLNFGGCVQGSWESIIWNWDLFSNPSVYDTGQTNIYRDEKLLNIGIQFQFCLLVTTALSEIYCRGRDVENGRFVIDRMEGFGPEAIHVMGLYCVQHDFAKGRFYMVDQMQLKEYGTEHRLGKIGDSIRIWAKIDPDLLLAVFLPALLFESAFSMEMQQIKRCMGQMLLLAGPGVLISTLFLGFALTFPYNWSWKTSLLLGGLLSATDHVAVIALLKELGASKKMSTIIEGESLMNDGIAVVLYQLFYRMVLGESFNGGEIVRFLVQNAFGAVGIGLAFGIASVLWLGLIFNDTVIEITLTVAMSYMAYFTAQEGFNVSGILAVMALGMFYAAAARTAFKGEGQKSLHHLWGMVSYIANMLVFILVVLL